MVLLSRLLESHSKEYVVPLTLCASVAVLLYVCSYVSEVLDFLRRLLEATQSSDAYTVLVKALGICAVTNLAVDVCRDANQNALSGVVLTTGKVAILLLSIPLLSELFEVVTQLL